jgi:hypothetical protein
MDRLSRRSFLALTAASGPLATRLLACSMFASVQVFAQGAWRNRGPELARARMAGVEINPFRGFQFDPLPNGVTAFLSPALDQPAVVVSLGGPPSFGASRTDVWVLRSDAMAAHLRTRWIEEIRGQDGPDRSIHYFVFDSAVSDVVGIAASIDGQLHVRALTPK